MIGVTAILHQILLLFFFLNYWNFDSLTRRTVDSHFSNSIDLKHFSGSIASSSLLAILNGLYLYSVVLCSREEKNFLIFVFIVPKNLTKFCCSTSIHSYVCVLHVDWFGQFIGQQNIFGNSANLINRISNSDKVHYNCLGWIKCYKFFFNAFLSFASFRSLPYISVRTSINHVFPGSIKLVFTNSRTPWNRYNSESIAYGTKIPSLKFSISDKCLDYFTISFSGGLNNQLFSFFWFLMYFVNLFTVLLCQQIKKT